MIAGLEAIVLAVAFLAAVVGLSALLRPLLLGVLGQAPLIGGWLAANVDAGLSRFLAAITPGVNAALPAFTGLLYRLYTTAWSWLNALPELAESTLRAVSDLRTLTLPQAIGAAEALVATWIAAAHADALGFAHGIESRLGAGLNLLRAQVLGLYSQALQYAAAQVGLEVARAQAVEQGLQAQAHELFLTAEADAANLAGRAEAVAAGLVAGVRAEAQAGIAAVESDLQALARAERVALQDSASILGGDLAAAEERAKAALAGLDAATQASIEGILKSTPWAVLAAQVGASEAMLQADVRTLVGLGAKAIRDELSNAEALRLKYGPAVRAALDQLRAKA